MALVDDTMLGGRVQAIMEQRDFAQNQAIALRGQLAMMEAQVQLLQGKLEEMQKAPETPPAT